MKSLGPKIPGRKTKAVRVDPSDLEVLRKEVKANEEWAQYADASDSDLVRIAIFMFRLNVSSDVYMMSLADINQLADQVLSLNIGEVARALGGVAHMNPDKTISVMRADAESPETLTAIPLPRITRTPTIN